MTCGGSAYRARSRTCESPRSPHEAQRHYSASREPRRDHQSGRRRLTVFTGSAAADRLLRLPRGAGHDLDGVTPESASGGRQRSRPRRQPNRRPRTRRQLQTVAWGSHPRRNRPSGCMPTSRSLQQAGTESRTRSGTPPRLRDAARGLPARSQLRLGPRQHRAQSLRAPTQATPTTAIARPRTQSRRSRNRGAFVREEPNPRPHAYGYVPYPACTYLKKGRHSSTLSLDSERVDVPSA